MVRIILQYTVNTMQRNYIFRLLIKQHIFKPAILIVLSGESHNNTGHLIYLNMGNCCLYCGFWHLECLASAVNGLTSHTFLHYCVNKDIPLKSSEWLDMTISTYVVICQVKYHSTSKTPKFWHWLLLQTQKRSSNLTWALSWWWKFGNFEMICPSISRESRLFTGISK